MYNITNLN